MSIVWLIMTVISAVVGVMHIFASWTDSEPATIRRSTVRNMVALGAALAVYLLERQYTTWVNNDYRPGFWNLAVVVLILGVSSGVALVAAIGGKKRREKS